MGKKNILCFLFIVVFCVSRTHALPPKSKSPNATRIGFGTSYGFYMVNTKHARSGQSLPGFNFGIRREYKTDRDYKTFFAFGLEYFMHGLTYESYFFKPDSLKLYDKSRMVYTYSLMIHEIGLPLQLKILFKRSDNSLFSPYISLGYHFRYLLTSNLNISENNVLVKKDSPDVTFRQSLLGPHINSFVSASLGWQKNNLASSKHSFFVELMFKYGFSQYSFSRSYSATSMYINGTHLCLMLGSKF
jgi:hypothetical protein